MELQTRKWQCYKLMLAMVLSFPIVPTVILMGGFIGSKFTPLPSLTTLPIAAVILGTVIGIIPANLLMKKFGRKAGLIIGTLYAQFFSLFAVFAIYQASFWLFCLSTFALGNSVSFVHQYRFAATEFLPENTAKAISIVLTGGIFGGALGPYIARKSMGMLTVEFAGCFLLLALMSFCAFLILLSFQSAPSVKIQKEEKARPLIKIISQPIFLTAILIAAFGYALMAMLMTAAPLSMKQDYQISIPLITLVIQTHLIAMYLPSFLSEYFIKKLGIIPFIILGFIFNYISYLIGYSFQSFWGFLISLFCLGIGWNFLFIGGTYLVVRSYRASEKFQVQAFNDFFVFGIHSIGALFSGTLLYYLSWQWLSIISGVIITGVFVLFLGGIRKFALL